MFLETWIGKPLAQETSKLLKKLTMKLRVTFPFTSKVIQIFTKSEISGNLFFKKVKDWLGVICLFLPFYRFFIVI